MTGTLGDHVSQNRPTTGPDRPSSGRFVPPNTHLRAEVAEETTLKRLVVSRHGSTSNFLRRYREASARIDSKVSPPSRSTLHRWLIGEVKPRAEHLQVLERLFPEWESIELFEPVNPRDERWQDGSARSGAGPKGGSMRGITAVFPTRTEFSQTFNVAGLLDAATDLDAMGLSLNVLCQQYPTQMLRTLFSRASVRLLFLDPDGEAIERRNDEEGHAPGHLSMWTRANMSVVDGVLGRLPAGAADRVQVRTYDETVRLNLTFIDRRFGIMQPYLPAARGLDSPTFITDRTEGYELFDTFASVFEQTWERAQDARRG